MNVALGLNLDRGIGCKLSPKQCMGKTELKSEQIEVYHLGLLLNTLLTKSEESLAGIKAKKRKKTQWQTPPSAFRDRDPQ